MLPSPYTPGEIPRVLAGRTAELGRIRDVAARIHTYGEFGGPLLVFHAPRGIGKTSLLRRGEQDATPLGFVCVWVSCSRGQATLPELAGAVERALVDAEVIRPGAQRGRTRLDRLGVELGAAVVKVRAELVRDPADSSTAGVSAPMQALETLLGDAARAVRERGGAGLLLFVDELHACAPTELGVLLNVLQNLAARRAENPLGAVVAGLPVTPEALTRAATFGERARFIALDTLAPSDARAALTEPAAQLGVRWTEPALDAVLAEARGLPYLLQLLGSTAWEAAGPGEGDVIGLAQVRAGIPAAQQQLDGMYAARWGAASPAEQAFLAAMARAAGDRENVARRQIAEELGRPSRAISAPRERLIEKGVIEPVGHGLVRFTLPGFAAYVRAR